MTAPPPRLFVLTATGSDAAIVLRRGPADWVAAIGWDRATDRFGDAHWLKARLYENRADISPDGRWWVYFALKGLRPYTVVAETPRLTASVFLPQCGTYGGGGRFDASGRLRILNDALDPVPWPPILPPRTMDDVPDPLLLRGWSEERRGGYSYFSKRFKGDWWLQRSCQIPSRASKVADRLGYRLYHPKTETAGPRPFWGWADILDGRLFYAAEGCLWSARPHGDGKEVDVRCIKDFSQMRPDPRP
ncbi:MAG TPA: hypothetical protein DDY29_01020 [Rhodobacteraceae bacterium]|jgi:hypothetical protein|nr:hypothetical protein [Paracoccaceae bacterium]HBG97353.1 hypothetical protein [Paracoccaceae bacterium]